MIIMYNRLMRSGCHFVNVFLYLKMNFSRKLATIYNFIYSRVCATAIIVWIWIMLLSVDSHVCSQWLLKYCMNHTTCKKSKFRKSHAHWSQFPCFSFLVQFLDDLPNLHYLRKPSALPYANRNDIIYTIISLMERPNYIQLIQSRLSANAVRIYF